MENLNIENALELYEGLDVSSRAADLYFDKVILNEAKGEGFKKILAWFKNQNDVNTTVNTMTASLEGMINCINMSPYATDEVKKADANILQTEYLSKIQGFATELASINSQMEELQKAIDAEAKGATSEEDGKGDESSEAEETVEETANEDAETSETTEETK